MNFRPSLLHDEAKACYCHDLIHLPGFANGRFSEICYRPILRFNLTIKASLPDTRDEQYVMLAMRTSIPSFEGRMDLGPRCVVACSSVDPLRMELLTCVPIYHPCNL